MRPLRNVLLFMLVFASMSVAACADVTLKSTTAIASLGNTATGTQVVELSGMRCRSELVLGNATTADGSPAGVNTSMTSVDLVRLDRGIIYRCPSPDDSCSTFPVSQLVPRLRGELGADKAPGLAGLAAAKLEWTVAVEPSPGTEKVAGYVAKKTTLTLTGTGTDPGGAPMTIVLKSELWNSTTVPGAREMGAFSKAFLEKSGVDDAALSDLLSHVPGAADALSKYGQERAKLAGVPIKVVTSVGMPSLVAMFEAMKQAGSDPTAMGLPALGPEGIVFTSTTELTTANAAKIAAARFEPPAPKPAASGTPDN